MSSASICSLSLVELANSLQQGELNSVEICQAFLDEAERASSLNCFITLDHKHILDAAAEADKLRKNGDQRSFLGVPVAIKDIILTEGMRTTCASRILDGFVPPYDATVMTRLKSDGFIPFGKTNMDEFAMGSSNETSYFGPVRNPWDTERVPGGSSGGSAAAVAARIAPAALGTDTGGSIRQPASLCGIVGLKPTYGRVSRYGVIAFASSLDQVGVFTQTAQDCAALTESICGHDPFDATSSTLPRPNLRSSIHESVKGLRIGIPKEYFIPGMNSEVESKIRKAIAQLADLGMEVVDISLPHSEAAVSVYYIVAPAEASSNLARYDGIRYGFRADDTKDLRDVYVKTRSQGFGDEVKRRIMIGTYVLSSGYYDAFYRRAQKVRTLITQDFRSVFSSQCDVIAAPTAPSTAFRLGEKTDNPLEMYLNDIFTIPVNLAGLPGLSIPCGFDQSGLPIGLQLIGKHWDEATLLRVASAYEQATEWHRKHPSRTWSTNQ